MGNPKVEYSIEEIDEILDLYKDKLKKEGKLLTKYKSKSVSVFNEYLVENNFKRKNGDSFKLYKYHFWAGKQNKSKDEDEEYNYGKKMILKRNQELSESLEGNGKNVSIQDIITIIEKNYKNPSKMTNLICSYIRKEQKLMQKILEENIKLTEENKKLKDLNVKMQDCFTNIFFNSQIANNSLNDMMTCKKSGDEFIQSELDNMFEDGLSRIEKLTNIYYYSPNENNNLQNIIQLDKKRREDKRMDEFDNDGF